MGFVEWRPTASRSGLHPIPVGTGMGCKVTLQVGGNLVPHQQIIDESVYRVGPWTIWLHSQDCTLQIQTLNSSGPLLKITCSAESMYIHVCPKFLSLGEQWWSLERQKHSHANNSWTGGHYVPSWALLPLPPFERYPRTVMYKRQLMSPPLNHHTIILPTFFKMKHCCHLINLWHTVGGKNSTVKHGKQSGLEVVRVRGVMGSLLI